MNYFLEFLSVQNTLKRFRYKYSILFNFQGPVFVGRLTCDLFILAPELSFVKHFFHLFLRWFEVLSAFPGLRPAAFRRALVYSTTFPGACQPLFANFFCGCQGAAVKGKNPPVFLVNIPKAQYIVLNVLTSY